MKILNVNMSIDPVTGGGTAERTLKVASYLGKYGVKSTLLTSDIGIDDNLINKLSNVQLHILKTVWKRYYLYWFNIQDIIRIIAQSDVVHLMNHWTVLNATAYLICRYLGKPYVVCPAGALLYFGRSLLLKRLYNLVIGKRIIRNAACHVAIPAEEASQFTLYNIDSKSVVVIPNGIDIDEFKAKDNDYFRRKYNLGNRPFILFMGRLNPIKGPDLLLHAFTKLKMVFPEYQLVFAGPDGGMLEQLKATTHEKALSDRVHFIGYIGGDEKSKAYHAADLLAIPSRKEAMSIVALEAGITGTPVLMTDVCGFYQIEKIGGGAIVKPNADALKAGLQEMLQDSGDLVRKGRRLKKYVCENYSWDSIILKYLSIFKSILDSPKHNGNVH